MSDKRTHNFTNKIKEKLSQGAYIPILTGIVCIICIFCVYGGSFIFMKHYFEEQETIKQCIGQEYTLLVDGIIMDANTVQDIDVFVENYHLLSVDEEKKTISVEHDID